MPFGEQVRRKGIRTFLLAWVSRQTEGDFATKVSCICRGHEFAARRFHALGGISENSTTCLRPCISLDPTALSRFRAERRLQWRQRAGDKGRPADCHFLFSAGTLTVPVP